mgnify:CR=1 FL=1
MHVGFGERNKDLRYLYNGLLRDMNRSTDDLSLFSNAYGIAQEATLNYEFE